MKCVHMLVAFSSNAFKIKKIYIEIKWLNQERSFAVKLFLQIWSTFGLVKSIDVNAAEKHGKILEEGIIIHCI